MGRVKIDACSEGVGGGLNPLEGRVKDPEMRGGEGGGVGISLV